MHPKVDIIITTYNREKLLPRAVSSVLEQEYSNLAIIIVDDGSTDNTKQYLKKLENIQNIKIIYHELNQGVTIAKNTGLNNLSPDSKYFGIFDSDDIMLPGAISSLVEIFEKHGDSISQVYGWCKDIRTGQFSGNFEGEGRFVKFEDAISGRLSGEFWQLFRKDYLGNLRFDERAAGGLSLVWHSLLKVAPGCISDTTVRIYDTSCPDRVSLPNFNKKKCKRKIYTYLSYLEKFKHELLNICPERYGQICLEVSRWAKLAGELGLSIKYCAKGALKLPVSSWAPVALQILIPKELVRCLKIKKYQNKKLPSIN
jgi:GalNAc5-diNAcBac-PP-undecaprenol beta-1,3-glucosyltransferase